MERLASADEADADLRRGVAAMRAKIGDVETTKGNLGTALASYQAALEILKRLVQTGRASASWQRDIAIVNGKIGELEMARGDAAAVLTACQAALARPPLRSGRS
jgi:hypothetical protein